MGRLPFNPDRIAAKKKKSSNEPISVSQLAAQIGRAIGDGLPTKVHVVGEVSGFRERTHWYFDLKDRDAVVNCAVWASAAKRLSVRPENGRTFVATGRVEHYAKGGRLTLVITSLEPLGRGSLDAEYRALCDELRERGYFDPGRKRDLPTLPKRVAVITSRSGAALQDILRTAEQRCPGVPWLIVDSRVQGDGAAAELVGRVRTIGFDHKALGVDVILLARGGGSLEDLWAFNDKNLARAIVECPIPVVTGIGHESDTTIAQLVADAGCSTPTQAAVLLLPDVEELLEQLGWEEERLQRALERRVSESGAALDRAAGYPLFANPQSVIDRARRDTQHAALLLSRSLGRQARNARLQLDTLATRLDAHRPREAHASRVARVDLAGARLASAMRHAVSNAQGRVSRADAAPALQRSISHRIDRVDAVARELRAVGPAEVLARGYSVTQLADGTVLRSSQSAARGAVLTTLLSDGHVTSTVGGNTRRRAGTMTAAGQMDLFGSKDYLADHGRNTRQPKEVQPEDPQAPQEGECKGGG